MGKRKPKRLFDPVVPNARLNTRFKSIMKHPGSAPARTMLEAIYQEFDDPDGNFLEQFQTSGFDARHFELYLFAYLSRSGFTVDRSNGTPDFLVTRDGLTVALEATTVNPSQSGPLAGRKAVSELSPEDFRAYEDDELPIRFGSALFSKLNRRYWELEHCRDKPLVLAIETFHDEQALHFTDAPLSQYLYGTRPTAQRLPSGTLKIDSVPVERHKIGEKVIPSNFFSQPDAEHISAVLFTNSGTSAKFSRMGYQHGYSTDHITIGRTGFFLNTNPEAKDPTFFSYNLEESPLVETWGQGLVVCHNPNALRPLPRDFFVDALEQHVEDGNLVALPKGWHPFSSMTYILHSDEGRPPKLPRFLVETIPEKIFRGVTGLPRNPIVTEDGWFGDESGAFLAVIGKDNADQDWGYAILARDERWVFRAIDFDTSLQTRDDARGEVYTRMAKLQTKGQRIFPGGVASATERRPGAASGAVREDGGRKQRRSKRRSRKK